LYFGNLIDDDDGGDDGDAAAAADDNNVTVQPVPRGTRFVPQNFDTSKNFNSNSLL
jgi:hypothetical protein